MMGKLKAFWLFWVDFLVGDAPELAIGVLVVLAIAFATRGSPLLSSAAVLGGVVLLLGFSTWRGRGK